MRLLSLTSNGVMGKLAGSTPDLSCGVKFIAFGESHLKRFLE
jgi:hypothetical protein